MKGKTAWVTGVAGFLGRHTAQAFSDAGWQVYGIGFGPWAEQEPESWGLCSFTSAEISTDNLNRLSLFSIPDVVIHCAGGSSVALSINDPEKDFQKTVVSLVALLDFIRNKTPQTKVIYPSSAAVYGSTGSGALLEETALSPCSPYGVHKLISEQLLDSYSKSFNLDTVAVRFFSLYGAGLQKQILWDACKKIQNNTFSFGGTGRETRDFLHVTDAANLLLQMATIPKTDQCLVVNGGSGKASTVARLLEQLAQASGSDLQPVFNGKVRSGDPQHLVSDSSKAMALGWFPTVGLDEGLSDYVAWYQKLVSKH